MGRSSRSRRSPCPYKLLGLTPQHEVGGSQETPNQSRRHHPPKGNRLDNDDELLALVLQDDRLLNTQSLSHRFGYGGRDWFGGKQLGEARDQDSYGRNGIAWSQHMSRWLSLRKSSGISGDLFWVLLFWVSGGGGVHIGISKNLTVTPLLTNSVKPK